MCFNPAENELVLDQICRESSSLSNYIMSSTVHGNESELLSIKPDYFCKFAKLLSFNYMEFSCVHLISVLNLIVANSVGFMFYCCARSRSES